VLVIVTKETEPWFAGLLTLVTVKKRVMREVTVDARVLVVRTVSVLVVRTRLKEGVVRVVGMTVTRERVMVWRKIWVSVKVRALRLVLVLMSLMVLVMVLTLLTMMVA